MLKFIKSFSKYKKKLVVYLSVIFLLIFIYCLTIIFDSQRTALRLSNYIWFDQRHFDLINRIEIFGTYRISSTDFANTTILDRKNNLWVISKIDLNGNIIDYPVRQNRVDDFLAVLSRRGYYPIRSLSQAMERSAFGNDPSRITIRGGSGPPLLDMLIGYTDHSTGSIFLRRYGEREIRSGEDLFTVYTESDLTFWYDLRLFPDINPAMVQRFHIFNIEDQEVFSLVRNMNSWIDENTDTAFPGADSYLRLIMDSRGESFVYNDNFNIYNSIILELGDGNIHILDIGYSDIDNNNAARIRGLPYIYSLSEWTVRNILRLDAPQ